jgi:hypothetical protein
MAKIHNTKERLTPDPSPKERGMRLNPALAKEEIAAILKPYNETLMAAYTVQKDFNKIRHEEGQLLPVFEYSELPGL